MYYYHNPKHYAMSVAAHSGPRIKQLAQAYVPEQAFRELYTPEEALKYGTVFKELNQSYGGKKR